MQTQEIVKYLINEFVHTLEHVNWMDETTRRHAIEKAKTMRTYIGYTDEMRNATLINELYDEVIAWFAFTVWARPRQEQHI